LGNTFTTNIFEPAVSYQEPSIYSIALKAVHSESLCSDSIMKKDLITVLDSSVFIPDRAAEGLKIFPNPAENELFIRIDNPSISVQCLDLYSIKGERLETIIPDSDIVRFKLQNYPSGTYLLVINLESGTINYRILKR
jgi:hypothetical protein